MRENYTGRRLIAGALLALGAMLAAYIVLLAYVTPGAAEEGGGTTNTSGKDRIIIDDRDRTQVCNNVVNIILDDVQNADVDNTQDLTIGAANSNNQTVTGETVAAGDIGNDQAVTVTAGQITNIAQELDVSPVIVQQCIQQIGDNNNANNNVNGKGNGGAGGTGGTNGEPTDLVPGSTPDKQLPNTGGSLTGELVFGGLLLLYAGLVIYRFRRS